MKTYMSRFFLILIGIGLVLYLFITGAADLVNTDARYTLDVDEACNILTVEHSINGLIPIGKDYYYVAVNNESGNAYVVHASKNWIKKTFIGKDNVQITGLFKKENDSDIDRELNRETNQFAKFTFTHGAKCLEVNYAVNAVFRILCGLLTIVVGVMGKLVIDKMNEKTIIAKIWLILFLVDLFMLFIIL